MKMSGKMSGGGGGCKIRKREITDKVFFDKMKFHVFKRNLFRNHNQCQLTICFYVQQETTQNEERVGQGNLLNSRPSIANK